MPIDATKPAEGVSVVKADLRANFQATIDDLAGKADSSHTHSAATTSVAGFMSAADKTKLDGVEALADVTDTANVTSAGALMAANNLSDVANAGTALTNLGAAATGHSHSDATTGASGFMSAADKTKLDGVEALADVTDTANVTSAGALMAANNLSDIGNAATALGNLSGAPLASPTFTGTVTLPAVVGGTTAPTNRTGSMAGVASGQVASLTGDVTAVPVTAGWSQLMLNSSGANRSITPASGNCVVNETGSTAASVSFATNKAVSVLGDGTNLWVFGDVV